MQVSLKAQILEGKAVVTSPLDAWLPANDGLIHMSLGPFATTGCIVDCIDLSV